MKISEVFTSVSYKTLALVDLPYGSHQHEIGKVGALRSVFGESKTEGEIHWYYFSDNKDVKKEISKFTFYDSRSKNPDRSPEWRMYYFSDFLNYALVDDVLILAISTDGVVHGLIFEQDSAWLRAAKILFEIETPVGQMKLVSEEDLNKEKLEYAKKMILEELEIGFILPGKPTDEQIVIEKFDRDFPSTIDMSSFARTQIEVDYDNPDETLLRWLFREEELFKALERVIVSKKLEIGFIDVDEFIRYSLSVQNRRKARMGYALENHLSALFDFYSLKYERGKTTEGKSKPDFLFPGQKEYLQVDFDDSLLVMLGVKSSCKDRWRQVLAEADKIEQKHLCTLEAGISVSQTDEMAFRKLSLVIPEEIQVTYTDNQREKIISVNEFLNFVREKQK